MNALSADNDIRTRLMRSIETWRLRNELSFSRAAKLIGERTGKYPAYQTVVRWARGERFPEPEWLEALYKASGGEIKVEYDNASSISKPESKELA